MHVLRFIIGLLLVGLTLLDGFETILLPRRISRRFRYSRIYYLGAWRVWRRLGGLFSAGRLRESTLSIFGPLSLIGLFVSWMFSIVLGFAFLHWSLQSPLVGNGAMPPPTDFLSCLYYSGTTCFTLGLGDITPDHIFSRFLTVVEGGMGFGFLAIIIGYLPVLYQAFSKREVTISLLDARAGSPPSGGEFLRRLLQSGREIGDDATLEEWEHWCAELLESHISFPVLAYYRSQHSNQSWLAALTTMLDSCALLLVVLPPERTHQVELTFAMARHAAVDIGLIFNTRPTADVRDRLSAAAATELEQLLRNAETRAGTALGSRTERFTEIRGMYEPFLEALSLRFLLALPPIVATERQADNWQRSAWMPRTPGIGSLPAGKAVGDHFNDL